MDGHSHEDRYPARLVQHQAAGGRGETQMESFYRGRSGRAWVTDLWVEAAEVKPDYGHLTRDLNISL